MRWFTPITALTLALASAGGVAAKPRTPAPPSLTTGLSPAPVWQVEGNREGAQLGFSVATAGDLNGDGYSDLAVGVENIENGQNVEGIVLVYHGTPSGPAAAPFCTLEVNQAGASLGWSVATAGDVNGDGYSDLIVGAPDYDNGQTDEGMVFVFHGSPSGISTTASWTAERNQAGSRFGSSVSAAGDVNGDGYGDVVVGQPRWANTTTGLNGVGRVIVYYGSATGLPASPSVVISGGQANAELGNAVATAGDVNGDGFSDVIAGSWRYDSPESEEGFVFVYHGSAAGLSTSAAWFKQGDQSFAYFGYSVGTAGDVNGDGFSDVIVGAERIDNDQVNEGRAFVYHGSAAGLSNAPDWITEGNQMDSDLGWSVATAGDVNGDGYADVIVGIPYYNAFDLNEGRVVVHLGSASGLSLATDWMVQSAFRNAYFGYSVATAGDLNGDGLSDVVIGAMNLSNGDSNEGLAAVYLGDSGDLAASPGWTASGANPLGGFGRSVSSAADVNGDGYADLVVGAPYEPGGGQVTVQYGSPAGLPAIPDWSADAAVSDEVFGYSVSAAGDVNGDGFGDVIVGGPQYRESAQTYGRSVVFHGSPAGFSTTPDWELRGGALQQFGASVAGAGDVNGDGYGDVIVGAPNAWGEFRGRAVVYFGTPTGLTQAIGWEVAGNPNDVLGWSVAPAGDVNGDGFSDVIVGAPAYGYNTDAGGAAHLYLGSTTGPAAAPSWSVTCPQENAGFGVAVAAAGDVNGDGYGDVLVGARDFDVGASDEGRVFLYLGSPSGLAAVAAWTADGGEAGAWLGNAVAGAGDLNRDGFADVVIGAPSYDGAGLDRGQARVYLGSAGGLPPNPAWTVAGALDSLGFGASVAAAGDINGDGFGDLIVGAPSSASVGANEGRADLYYGGEGPHRRSRARQMRMGGLIPIAHLGASDHETQFELLTSLPSVFGRTRLGLEYEVKPLGTPFDGQGTTFVPWLDTGVNGQAEHDPVVSGLTPGAVYHWRCRSVYDLSRTPFLPYGPWTRMPFDGWNEGDLRTAGGGPVAVSPGAPAHLELLAAGANPGRDGARVRFTLPHAARVHADVLDASGRRIAALARGESFAAGAHELHWDGRDPSAAPAPAGAYFVRVRAGGETRVRKAILLR